MTTHRDLLFDFSDPGVARRFTAIDDRVMGGVSKSTMRADSGSTVFEGELSTENNGGFASVRSEPMPVDLSGSAGIALRVRGDGRTYKLRLRTGAGLDGVSYQASFATTDGEWRTIQLPFRAFHPTFRGQARPAATPLDPSAVVSFGLLVSSWQTGGFRLELGWMRPFGQC